MRSARNAYRVHATPYDRCFLRQSQEHHGPMDCDRVAIVGGEMVVRRTPRHGYDADRGLVRPTTVSDLVKSTPIMAEKAAPLVYAMRALARLWIRVDSPLPQTPTHTEGISSHVRPCATRTYTGDKIQLLLALHPGLPYQVLNEANTEVVADGLRVPRVPVASRSMLIQDLIEVRQVWHAVPVGL